MSLIRMQSPYISRAWWILFELGHKTFLKSFKTESQNFLDPRFSKPLVLVNVGFKNADLIKIQCNLHIIKYSYIQI